MFLLASGFYIINCNSRWTKMQSNHFSQRKASLVTIATPINTKRGKNVASTAITTSSATTIVKAYSTASLIRKVEPIYYLTKIDQILQENQCGQERKRKQAEKLEDFISYRWKSRCFFHAPGYLSSQHWWFTASLPYLSNSQTLKEAS